MSTKVKIQADLVAAMKAGDATKVSVLRMLKAAVLKFEVSGKEKKEANDEEVTAIIGKEVKQRKESADAFTKGGRADLVQKEEAELALLQTYMPAQLSEVEITKIAEEAIAQTGANGKQDFGKVMGAVMPRVKGKADGQLVSKVVGALLK